MRNRHTFLAAAFGVFALGGGSRAAEPVATPAGQRDQQKRANAAVEQTARQVTTTLRKIGRAHV